MRNTEFKTKEEYLQYRNDWKDEYKQVSANIRELKNDIRNLQREGNPNVGIYQSSREKHRKQATLMLIELKLAKEEAHKQYLAAKDLRPVDQ